jgi:hypothetical protein
MAWHRVRISSNDPVIGEMSQRAFFGALDAALRAQVPPNTIAARKAKVYKKGDATACEILIPPQVAMVARSVLAQFEGKRLVIPPDVNDFKLIEI